MTEVLSIVHQVKPNAEDNTNRHDTSDKNKKENQNSNDGNVGTEIHVTDDFYHQSGNVAEFGKVAKLNSPSPNCQTIPLYVKQNIHNKKM